VLLGFITTTVLIFQGPERVSSVDGKLYGKTESICNLPSIPAKASASCVGMNGLEGIFLMQERLFGMIVELSVHQDSTVDSLRHRIRVCCIVH
jgi:hypothetical protein